MITNLESYSKNISRLSNSSICVIQQATKSIEDMIEKCRILDIEGNIEISEWLESIIKDLVEMLSEAEYQADQLTDEKDELEEKVNDYESKIEDLKYDLRNMMESVQESIEQL